MRKQSNIKKWLADLKQLSPFIWLALVCFIGVAICNVIFWEFLNDHDKVVRNIDLVSVGIVGLPLLLWRGHINERIANTGQQSHVAGTYTRAIQQLGAEDKNGKPHLELRLGALYAMEKIARANREYHPQIMDVLFVYVRMHAPVPKSAGEEAKTILDTSPLREDIQTVLTIIGRRNKEFDTAEQRLNLDNTTLVNTDLRGANLSGANLSGANLSKANLIGANLIGANLRGANLSGAFLIRAFLNGTNLGKANLSRAFLNGANLGKANLSGVDLSGVDLSGADLSGADLSGADLNGTFLIRANLSEADLSGADLSDADLSEANLEKTVLRGVSNLTDGQLERARNWKLARR